MITVDEIRTLLPNVLQPFFERAGCTTWGLLVKQAAHWADSTQQPLVLAGLPLPQGQICHDKNKAPYLANNDGAEIEDICVSFTDEEDVAVCVWAQLPAPSPTENGQLQGFGVDLATKNDFDHGLEGRRIASLVLEEHEVQLGDHLYKRDPKTGFAYLFSAKEASFKSLAKPLRRWSVEQGKDLHFDVRSFEMVRDGVETGGARHADAQQAMETLSIARLAVEHVVLQDAVFSIAGAFSS